jgi:hypothetical protein
LIQTLFRRIGTIEALGELTDRRIGAGQRRTAQKNQRRQQLGLFITRLFPLVGDIDNPAGADGDLFMRVIQRQHMQHITPAVGRGHRRAVRQGQRPGGDRLPSGAARGQAQILGGKLHFFIVAIAGEMIDDQFHKASR